MPKLASPTYSRYARQAILLLGRLIRANRIEQAMTTSDLAARAGISRSLLHRIERGDPGCSIGAVFEVAAIVGVPLFEPESRALARVAAEMRDRLTLLPKAVRGKMTAVKDDF